MSGSSGQAVNSVARFNSTFLSSSDDQNISSLLAGSAWSGTTITYSFPTSSAYYGTRGGYGDPAPFNGFAALSAQQQGEVLRAFSLISSYTNLTFTPITESTTVHASIRFANSTSPPTAYAYYPATNARGGDVFFGGTGQNPVMGNFDSGQATLHEIGHALGLKHGQENNTYGVMNADRLDIEFSLMNYANYIGSTEGYATASTSPQTYMMYDIAALQYMYGADFSRAGQNDTFTWSATTGEEFINGVSQGTPVDNHIFETIWTQGANSTYDLSNFSQDQVDDMNPGGWMLFSTSQLADLNAFAPSKPSGEIYARGDIYNALEYNGDARSLIDNIITGSGNDRITGNAANNVVDGGGGTNTFVESGQHTDYAFKQLSNGYVQITDERAGSPDGVDTVANVENFQFSDGLFTAAELSCFYRGTLIGAPGGDVPVETLKRGDLVATSDGRRLPVRWLGRQTVSTKFADPLRVLPIRIEAGALGEGVPSRELLLSPDHALLVDGVLIQAGALVNGTSIVRETKVPRTFVYYHVELDDHSLILAENTPAETFIDNVDRMGFDNWAEHEALYPEGKAINELSYPRAKAHRQVPMRIRAALDGRAKIIGVLESAVA